MDNLEIVKEISSLKEQNISQDRRLKDLEDDTKNLPKLEALMEMVIKTNQEQAETNKELSKTMIEVKDNMAGLNGEMKNLSSQVGTLGQRVEKLEENEDEKKIDLGKLVKQIVWVAVPSLIVAAIVFYFGWK